MVVAKTKVYFRDGGQLVLHIYSMVGGDKCVEVEARREESGPEAVGRAVGPLITITLFAEECRGWPVNIWLDNAGPVRIWQKGYSSWCQLSSTIS